MADRTHVIAAVSKMGRAVMVAHLLSFISLLSIVKILHNVEG